MTEPLRERYPAIEPFDTGMLAVSGRHRVYYEQVGNPSGQPVVFVHGGPGAGCSADDRTFFDPEAYRIILFDQRGCGRSTPHACTEDNTTWDLVADMEALREHLGVDTWMLFGGSWGSTLSLAYAETHPERARALVLRGVFLLTQAEFNWFYRDGTPFVFPEAAEQFHSLVSSGSGEDMVAAYHAMITGKDEALRRRALEAWARWEAETLSLHRNPKRIEEFTAPDFADAFAGIELHYFVNRGFLKSDGQLLKDADRLRDIPGVIVHGRYDMICPVRNAVQLAKIWQSAKLQIIPDAGHTSFEPGITDALVRATDAFRNLAGTCN